MKIYNFIFILLMSLSAYGQFEYPLITVDSIGQEILILTLDQARDLDNISDIGIEMMYLNQQMIVSDSLCQNLLNSKDSLVVSLEESISIKDSLIENKSQQIRNLETQIEHYIESDSLYTSEINNKKIIIEEQDEKISELKIKGILSSSVNIIMIILISIL